MSGVNPIILLAALGWLALGQAAFVSQVTHQHVPTRDASLKMQSGADLEESRRGMLQNVAVTSFGLASGLVLQNQAACASGGATAGGVYLLSAKQRYNDRVVKAVRAFLSLGPSLEGGSIDQAKDFFTNEEPGTWKDGSAAGYLLANAFRRSSATPPDSLPAVKV